MQLFCASVDTIAPFSSRDGICQMWFDKEIQIDYSKTIRELKDHSHHHLEANGAPIHVKERNWDANKSCLKMVLPLSSQNSIEIQIRLATTLFFNSELVSCFYMPSSAEIRDVNPEYLKNGNQFLMEAGITFPRLLGLQEVHWLNCFTEILTPPLTITLFKGNLIKELNHKSASSFLQDNKSFMDSMDKETKIYAVLLDSLTGSPLSIQKYEVIAGGGSWGAKSNTLVLEPEASKFLKKGQSIKFYYINSNVTSSQIISSHEKFLDAKNLLLGGLMMETSAQESSYATDNGEEREYENLVSFGSEKRLQVNGTNFNSQGELVVFPTIRANNTNS